MYNYTLILTISIGTLLFSNTLFLIALILSKKKNKKLSLRVANLDEVANESYVKFISDSRDWAYEYIEDVQPKLTSFANKVEPQLNYYNTYGQTVQGPHIILVKEISEAYEELKTIMPQENKEK